MSARAISRRAFFALASGATIALGLERTPVGGTLRLDVPWRLDGLDPHDPHDPVAALLGLALFDTLYGSSPSGPFPSLAHALPEARTDGTLAIELRPNLLTSAGQRLTARDVAWSLERARSRGAGGVLGAFSTFRAMAGTPFVVTTGTSAASLAEALTSPVTAIVSQKNRYARTESTGAFRMLVTPSGLELTRNAYAARGAPFIERITIRAAADLAAALRSFEAGDADLGWLGAGLHGRRKDAAALDGPGLGWIVLRIGREGGAWSAPGVAQTLLDGIAADRLAPLGLRSTSPRKGSTGWTGPATTLLVDQESPYFVEVARTVAAALRRPGHDLTVALVSHREITERRVSGEYPMMLDFVRSLSDRPHDVQLALLGAESPRLARNPPRVAPATAEDVARTLKLGVVGRLSVTGAIAPHVHGLETWRLADAWLATS